MDLEKSEWKVWIKVKVRIRIRIRVKSRIRTYSYKHQGDADLQHWIQPYRLQQVTGTYCVPGVVPLPRLLLMNENSNKILLNSQAIKLQTVQSIFCKTFLLVQFHIIRPKRDLENDENLWL
jgi:hypothetical protein